MELPTVATMRGLLIASIVVVPTLSFAEKPLVVWQDRVIDDGPTESLSVSRTLYLNNCMPNGCTVTPGSDNSMTNHSSIPTSTVTLDAYSHGDEHWAQLVACVRETFKPFNVQIVTEDPGATSHFEVMIGGTSKQLKSTLDAGGVAPFISCGATRNNAISFVFAGQTSGLDYLCAAIAQEACHIWGLDHELNADDPMTYLDIGSSKRFQNDDAQCGESSPRGCRCSTSTQNSFRYMSDTFGLNPSLTEPTLTLTKPVEGQWVKPKFPVSAVLSSELYMLDAFLAIDGAQTSQAEAGIIAFNAPELAAGKHVVTVSATDAGDRTVMQTVNVNVVGACAADGSCPSGTLCLGGLCLPGAGEVGGLGSSCAESGDCITGNCASDGSDTLCTGSCDAGGSCPSGFDCQTGSNVCWPNGGGCSSGGGGTSLGFAGLGAFALAVRRRRR